MQAQPALGALTAQGHEVAGNAAASWSVRQAAPRTSAAASPVEPAAAPRPASQVATLISRALRLRAAGRSEEAIPLLRQAVLLDPANAAARHELGSSLLDRGQLAEAADHLATAVRLDPNRAMSHYHLGLALSRQGKAKEAIASHRAAVAIAPSLADAHFELGRLHYERRSREPAAEAFERAAAAAPNTSNGREAAARALIARGQREEAIAVLRRARKLDPKVMVIPLLLAHTLVRTGRFEEAEQVLREALAVSPSAAAGWFELTSLRKMTPDDRPLAEPMLAALRTLGCSARDRLLLHFALGKLYDDLREFAVARKHFDEANRIRAGVAPLDRTKLVRTVNRLIELFPAPADSPGDGDERPVLIVGIPRSGTTLTEQILSSHPEVAGGGELGFWAENAGPVLEEGAPALAAERLETLAGGYRAVLREVSPEARRVTDKNPFNFLHLGLISRAFPYARIIHCRRHPVDTCLSIYTTYLASPGLEFMGNREDLVFYYRQYERLMRHWRQVLPPERFVEIDYEWLITDREAETRRLLSFSGLEWNDACLRPESNRRSVETASVWQARQPVYRSSMERWRNYEPWLGPLAQLMPGEAVA
jgi:tetratricopeptide (TPR) repeat protein